MYIHVAHVAVLVAVAFGGEGHILREHLRERAEFVGAAGEVARHLDTDDYVGTHALAHVNGEVVDQAAVGQQVRPPFHGREDTRDGHAGAYGQREGAAADYDGVAGDDVGGHTGVGYGQAVEVGGVGIAYAEAAKKVLYVAAVDDGRRHGVDDVLAGIPHVAQCKRYAEEFAVGIVTALGGEEVALDAVRHEARPVDAGDYVGELVGFIAEGIEAADDGAHAGAGHETHGDAHLFEVFEHADMGGTLGAAATKHHADARAAIGLQAVGLPLDKGLHLCG